MRCPELGESTVPDTGTRYIPYVPDAQDVTEDGGKDMLWEDARYQVPGTYLMSRMSPETAAKTFWGRLPGTRYVPDAQDVPEDGGKDLLREDAALLDRLHEELLHNLQLAQVRLLAVDDLGYGLENNEVQVDLISNFKVK